MKPIIPIYEVQNYFTEERYQFIPIEMISLYDKSFDSQAELSLREYLSDKSCPIDPYFPNNTLVYTWDYYRWEREYRKPKKLTERSINRQGLGYCGGCGTFSYFIKKDEKWECQKCNYKHNRIFDYRYKKEN